MDAMQMKNANSRVLPAPLCSAESQPFWDAAAAGQLLFKHCLDCRRLHWYPRARCPYCLSANTAWQQAAGTGVIYSFSVMRRVERPYVVAFVTLDEGLTVLTNLEQCNIETLRIGQRVALIFRAAEDGTAVPLFRPLHEDES